MNPQDCPAQPRPGEAARDCPARADGALEPTDTKGVDYEVRGGRGRYEVWLRVYVPKVFGNRMGAAASDSVYLTLDGEAPMVVGDGAPAPGAWTWIRAPHELRLDGRSHRLGLRVRERGLAVDRLVVQAAGSPPPTDRPSPQSTTTGPPTSRPGQP